MKNEDKLFISMLIVVLSFILSGYGLDLLVRGFYHGIVLFCLGIVSVIISMVMCLRDNGNEDMDN